LVLHNIFWTKNYFGILDNLYMGQKVVIWFWKLVYETKFLVFVLSLRQVCHVSKTILQIKCCTSGVVICHSFFRRSNTQDHVICRSFKNLVFFLFVMWDYLYFLFSEKVVICRSLIFTISLFLRAGFISLYVFKNIVEYIFDPYTRFPFSF